MTRYQFAKIVEWAGVLRSRKRIQKMVYLLKAVGFPTDADFLLHIYGPYSFDVASITNELTQVGFLIESAQPGPRGETFDYRLADRARERLRELEATPQGQTWLAEIGRFTPAVKELADTDVSVLEMAATITYFQQSGRNLGEASDKAYQFKRLPPDGDLALRSNELVGRLQCRFDTLQVGRG